MILRSITEAPDWIEPGSHANMFVGEVNGIAVAWGSIDARGPQSSELRWVVHPDHRWKGYGRQLARLLLDKVTTRYATATIDPVNRASLKTALSLGMKLRRDNLYYIEK